MRDRVDTAVVYLARFAEGREPIARFARSYKRRAPGLPHDLLVVWKGFPASGAEHIQEPLNDVIHQCFDITDEGFDLTAYAAAARRSTHTRIAFLNTFSEILADDWLKKLDSAFADPSVGLAGATGSYESLHTSLKEISKVVALCQWGIPYDHVIARRWGHELVKHAPAWLRPPIMSKWSARLKHVFRGAPGYPADMDARFEQYWSDLTVPGGPMAYFAEYQPFPNPHVRTNGFMVPRELFLEILPSSFQTKLDVLRFESGAASLTQAMRARGLRPVIVGANGLAYDIERWPSSETFRLGQQSNLLISDNRTRAYDQMDADRKRQYTAMSY